MARFKLAPSSINILAQHVSSCTVPCGRKSFNGVYHKTSNISVYLARTFYCAGNGIIPQISRSIGMRPVLSIRSPTLALTHKDWLRKYPSTLIPMDTPVHRCISRGSIGSSKDPTKQSNTLKHLKTLVDLTRLNKPVGYLLLFYPFAFSIVMATYGNPNMVGILLPALKTATGYFFACVLMRSAGCIVNDIWDRKIDYQVVRTATRPIPGGRISPQYALGTAVAIFILTLSSGYLLMDQKTLNLCIAFGGASVLYPLSKRYIQMPQVVLGSLFSCGSFIGWLHLCGSINFSVVIPLYLSCICWTIIYDTIYAMQDKDDDKMINVKSTAIYFGEKVRPILTGLLIAMTSLMAISGLFNHQGLAFYLLSVSAPFAIIAMQIIKLNNMRKSGYGQIFTSNSYIGALILVGMMIDVCKSLL